MLGRRWHIAPKRERGGTGCQVVHQNWLTNVISQYYSSVANAEDFKCSGDINRRHFIVMIKYQEQPQKRSVFGASTLRNSYRHVLASNLLIKRVVFTEKYFHNPQNVIKINERFCIEITMAYIGRVPCCSSLHFSIRLIDTYFVDCTP